ncbi:hypothetical protein [Planctopirus hydrillae]|uniref:Uncharacterized protein n=1 Tax=Planctopirus hydrillae TaxID=1841610 RepID=A0A1C3EHS2_9PLAN|nr:hypothetical protein [Planctopirus hydrillae]ODA32763.1 hypothetical protein A6X21_20740 [Planctopirus hydrillae]
MYHKLLCCITLCTTTLLWAQLPAQEIAPEITPQPVVAPLTPAPVLVAPVLPDSISSPPAATPNLPAVAPEYRPAATHENLAAPPSKEMSPTNIVTVNYTPDGSAVHTFGAGTASAWTVTITPGFPSTSGLSSLPGRLAPNMLIPPAPAAQSTPATAENSPTVADHPCLNCDMPHPGTGALTGVMRAHHYTEVYNQIPFSRSEYDANPAYRHDATMELLLGQIRPVTYQTTNVNVATGGWSPWINYYRGFWGYPWGYQPFGYYAPRYRTYVRW